MKRPLTLILSSLFLFGAAGLAFSGCTPKYEDFETEKYVDVIPENSEDGVTLHAFCWTLKQIKDNLPAIADAGFKNVLTMPMQQPKGGGAAWWAYYQPLSFSIADNSGVGNKQNLKALCDEAEKYNISILVDVVANHLANISDSELESDGTPKVSPAVEAYEPVLYRNRNSDEDGNGITFHHNKSAAGSGAETQYYAYGALPDLNTANPYVQGRVLSYLDECIDVGVDGFRFDAAKHIETPTDPQYPSNFWNNTVEVAKTHYKAKTGKDLYVFGEVLNTPQGRNVSAYLPFMRVTEDGFTASYKSSVLSGKNLDKISGAEYGKSSNASDLVAWVESHDEFTTASSHLSDYRIAEMWALLASRKDLGAIYLARPDDNATVGQVASYAFESAYTTAINRFHNRFTDAAEYWSDAGTSVISEKVSATDEGAMIVNLAKKIEGTEEVILPHIDNGNYYDALTGARVVVTNHKCKINFDKYGISILTRTNRKEQPRFTISQRDGTFVDDLEIEVGATHFEEGKYYFNDETTKYELGETTKIHLKDHVKDDRVVLNIELKNGDNTVKRAFTYNKVHLIEGKFNVININPKYFEDYEIYIWAWEPGTWTKNYEVKDGVLLFDATGKTGFLLGIFEKGYVITDVSKWDPNVIKQSGDIKGSILSQGFFDASGL